MKRSPSAIITNDLSNDDDIHNEVTPTKTNNHRFDSHDSPQAVDRLPASYQVPISNSSTNPQQPPSVSSPLSRKQSGSLDSLGVLQQQLNEEEEECIALQTEAFLQQSDANGNPFSTSSTFLPSCEPRPQPLPQNTFLPHVTPAPPLHNHPPHASTHQQTQTHQTQAHTHQQHNAPGSALYTFSSDTLTGQLLHTLQSNPFTLTYLSPHARGATLTGFVSLSFVTASTSLLSPMRDAAALAIGVQHIPTLTLASTLLAILSSVPVGWLFEAPDPARKNVWKRLGLTRGETQGTSLALFYRVFGVVLVGYALGFKFVEYREKNAHATGSALPAVAAIADVCEEGCSATHWLNEFWQTTFTLHNFGSLGYVAFFLIVHLMRLHSISLIWGVATEAMEYEEQAEKRKKDSRILEEQEEDYDEYGDFTNTGTGGCPPNTEEETPKVKSPVDAAGGTKARLERLAFVGFGGTMGGIAGSVIASTAAHKLHLSGLLLLTAILLELCANLSTEMGKIMQRHWLEEKRYQDASTSKYRSISALSSTSSSFGMSFGKNSIVSVVAPAAPPTIGGNFSLCSGVINNNSASSAVPNLATIPSDEMASRDSTENMMEFSSWPSSNTNENFPLQSQNSHHQTPIVSLPDISAFDSSLKRSSSSGSMKRVASGNSINNGSMGNLANLANMTQQMTDTSDMRSLESIENSRIKEQQHHHHDDDNASHHTAPPTTQSDPVVEDGSFRKRLLRGLKTILRSKLLMAIFTYNALFSSTTVLLSFQRAELVANRDAAQQQSPSPAASSGNRVADTAFLAKIATISNMAVFALQASGLGARIAHRCGQKITLSLMPIARVIGVLMLVAWHFIGGGNPPNLILFLMLDECTRVINSAIAKPVRENLWRGLSNEARYEAKPIVDTLANRWGSGSAAFMVSLVDRMIVVFSSSSSMEVFVNVDESSNTKTLLGFPPLLVLCFIAAMWWMGVSTHLGMIRSSIDAELKKEQ